MKRIILILIGITFLALGLIYGSIVEITTQPAHRIGTILLTVLIIFSFYILINNCLKIPIKYLKYAFILLISLLMIPYLWIGLWSVPQAIITSNYPLWNDVSISTNKDNKVLIGQWIEISGSIHSMQTRKLIYDFKNGIRISYIYPENKINGQWTVHQIGFGKDTVINVIFEKGRIKN